MTFPSLAATVLLVLATSQDPETLVDRLGASDIEERGRAEEQLLTMGKKALKALDRAAAARDPEVSDRARRLARRIRAQGALSPAIRKAIPDAESTLVNGEPADWAALVQQVTNFARTEDVAEADLSALVLGALDVGDPDGVVLRATLDLISSHRLEAAAPDLVRRLPSATGGLAVDVMLVLERLDAADARPAIEQLLSAEDIPVRTAACRALARLGTRKSIAPLAARLGDAEHTVRLAAWQALITLAPDSLLARRDEAKGEDAIRILTAALPASAIQDLRQILAEGTPSQRVAAGRALLTLRDRGAIPGLRALLARRETQEDAADLLAAFGELTDDDLVAACEAHVTTRIIDRVRERGLSKTAPLLVQKLPDMTWPEREAAIAALDRFQSRDLLPAIRKLLSQNRRWVIAAAVMLQGVLGDREAIPSLRTMLKDPDPCLRGAAAFALGRLGDRDSGAAILRLLTEEPEERDGAIEAVAQLQLVDAVPFLVALANTSFESGGSRAASALTRMPRDAVLRCLPEVWETPNLLRVAAELKLKEAAPAIRRLLVHRDCYMRTAAVQALWTFGETDPAVTALDDRHELVRERAVELVGSTSHHWEKIADKLADPDDGPRGAAIRILSASKPALAIRRAKELLKHPSSDVRLAAVELLQEARETAEFAALENDPSARVRRAIERKK